MKSTTPIKIILAGMLTLFNLNVVIADTMKQPIVIADVGFSTPESAEYYAPEDVYLVANINGSPFGGDTEGFISKVGADGRMLALKWIDGAKQGTELNAPKGLAIAQQKLFVADVDQVHIFELPSGKPLRSVKIDGSTFLNGITHSTDGSIYVTDSGYAAGLKPSGTDAIYKVHADGSYKKVFGNKSMGHPNGILEDGKQLVVVTFGSGEMYRIDRAGKQTAMPTPPKGKIDGLLRLDNGHFLLSSWEGAAIYALDRDQAFSVLAENLDSPADLGLDTKRNRVLIPLFKENKLVLLPL